MNAKELTIALEALTAKLEEQQTTINALATEVERAHDRLDKAREYLRTLRRPAQAQTQRQQPAKKAGSLSLYPSKDGWKQYTAEGAFVLRPIYDGEEKVKMTFSSEADLQAFACKVPPEPTPESTPEPTPEPPADDGCPF